MNNKQRFERMPNLATPEEQHWINEYARWVGFGPASRYKVSHRDKDGGGFNFVTVLCRRGNGYMIGMMALSVEWIKPRVKREKARYRRELTIQAVLETGAYI